MVTGAKTPDEVVQIAQEFVAQLAASEIHVLPEACRAPRFTTPEDVRRYALTLVQHGHGDNARLTLRVSQVLSAAAVRIAELQRQPGRPS